MKYCKNMRYIYLFMATVLMALLTVSCDQDLPYPLDDVKNGVVIDIARIEGTDGVLSAGSTDGNYKVKLTIPKQQGDYSSLDYAQILCVFTDVSGKTTSKVVVDNIKDFPTEVAINFADVYKGFGLTVPALGETVSFTINTVLKDGLIVYGWNAISGFNNKAFTGWEIDGRAYSYNVRYPVACPLVLDDFVGEITISDPGFVGADYPAEAVKISDTELEIRGFLGEEAPFGVLKIVVDPSTHTVSVAKQVVSPTYGSYHNLSYQATGTIDACNGMITLNGPMTVDEGSFGDFGMTIKN